MVIMLIVIMLNVTDNPIMPSVICAECRYAECRGTICLPCCDGGGPKELVEISLSRLVRILTTLAKVVNAA